VRWIVGDVHGCARELEALLKAIRFDARHDELWSVGDLVNRGPDSLAVLEIWRNAHGRAVLGNHERNALLSHAGRHPRKLESLEALFRSPRAEDHLRWMRSLPVLVQLPPSGRGPAAWIVHAGLHPRWQDLAATAARLDASVHDDDWLASEEVGFATGVRFCTASGERSDDSGPPEACRPPFRPWDAYYRGTTLVVHGHWATRGHYRTARTMSLDTGCVYGGALTAWCQDEDRLERVGALERA
jgi:bis(5'-nucleosyl)-tetraphosphatase (symmetrical)